jgi:integrase
MRDLNYLLKVLQDNNKDGSFSTRAARAAILNQAANTLYAMGYRRMNPNSLKQKHVGALVDHWSKKGLTPGTIKNRMAHIRWWAEKVGRPAVIAKDNGVYAIPNRQYVTNTDKSRMLDERVQKITDHHVRMSVRLQAAFGLRREEAIKFIPAFADRGDRIVLKSTWTKGGKEREIPVRNDQQRTLLDEARLFAGRGAMIPSNKNYVAQLRTYERNLSKAGLDKLHGLRHAYAQTRYVELTGWPCPIQGGKHARDMTGDEREQDQTARLTISHELGHERREILSIYCGV